MKRKSCTEVVKPYYNSDATVTVRWRFTRPGALYLRASGLPTPRQIQQGIISIYTRFCSGSFQRERRLPYSGIGEQPNTWHVARNTTSLLSGKGPPQGTAQQWAEGLDFALAPFPLHVCELAPQIRERRMRGVIAPPFGLGVRVGPGYEVMAPPGPVIYTAAYNLNYMLTGTDGRLWINCDFGFAAFDPAIVWTY